MNKVPIRPNEKNLTTIFAMAIILAFIITVCGILVGEILYHSAPLLGSAAASAASLTDDNYKPEEESLALHISNQHGLPVGPADNDFLQVKSTANQMVRVRFGPNGPKPELKAIMEKKLGWKPGQILEFNRPGYQAFLLSFHSHLDEIEDEADKDQKQP